MALYFKPAQVIEWEITQRKEEGYDVTLQEKQIREYIKNNPDATLHELYNALPALDEQELEASFPYKEPSALEEIRAERPDGPRRMAVSITDEELQNRISGAWLGRAAGCMLGKPVEGWLKEKLDDYLKKAGALPLDDYIPFTDDYWVHPLITGQAYDAKINRIKPCTRGNISCMVRDDDMDFPIINLHIIEQYGQGFTARQAGETWLDRMAYYNLYGAERQGYRNMVNGIWPPDSASFNNPFREFIASQIRADIWGYIFPGWPEKAAELAFRDASMTSVKNGIYGEMFFAALMAAAWVSNNIDEIINIGLSEIPKNCRFSEAVHNTVGWCREYSDWDATWAKINEQYGHYAGVHVILNATLVIMALMYAQHDYEKSIVLAVRGGWDTDCNGATAGSILGLLLGADKLPGKWIGVLNDRVLSAVREEGDNKISELAKRTYEVTKKVMALGE